LAKQSTKDFLAAAHKNGESISEVLKGKQEAVWAELGVEAQFGFTTIQRTLNDPSTMTEKLRGALLQAAAAEDGILTYALVGSQEKFEAEQARLKRLTEEAQMEVQTKMAPLYQQQNEAALNSYYEKIQAEFNDATKDFEGQDEIGRLKMRQNLTDQQYKAIVKGQMLQQIKAYQMQAMQMQAQMGGQGRTQ
jgi:hypothetical protein